MEYIGKRMPDETGVWDLEPLQYCKYKNRWYGVSPNGLLANLSKHSVVENEDKTITVEPSILVSIPDKSWHGYLINGVWRE